jgi:hypothetical protein
MESGNNQVISIGYGIERGNFGFIPVIPPVANGYIP